MMIKVMYRSCDGYYQDAMFDNIKEAQGHAQYWLGKHPDLSGMYAVSNDGIATIQVEGTTLDNLFPPPEDERSVDQFDPDGIMNNGNKLTQADYDYSADYWASLGIKHDRTECKCGGNGYCEYHDDYNAEDDGYAV